MPDPEKIEIARRTEIDVAGPNGGILRFHVDNDDPETPLGVQVLGPLDEPDETPCIWFSFEGFTAIERGVAAARCDYLTDPLD